MIIDKDLIIQAKNNMGEKAAFLIAEDLSLENFDNKNLKCSCPWHSNDNTPSLIWNSDDNYYHCFACNHNYGIIDHYMSHYGLTFLEAVEKLFIETNTKQRFAEKGVKSKKRGFLILLVIR